MGHERISVLPKSKRWRRIVGEISHFQSEADINNIAALTLEAVADRYQSLHRDPSVLSAFESLVEFAYSQASNRKLPATGDYARTSEESTPIDVVRQIQGSMRETKAPSTEYQAISERAVADALLRWFQKHDTSSQCDLFATGRRQSDVWRGVATGSGFSELTRLFFASITTRYLSYFLDREASAQSKDLSERVRFQESLVSHVDSVSQHAFETAGITQSFAAGWFNKNSASGQVSKQSVRSFLRVAFGKISEEVAREAQR
jgi:hypothetical protein